MSKSKSESTDETFRARSETESETESVSPSDEPRTSECPLFAAQVKEKCRECGDVVYPETRDKCAGCSEN